MFDTECFLQCLFHNESPFTSCLQLRFGVSQCVHTSITKYNDMYILTITTPVRVVYSLCYWHACTYPYMTTKYNDTSVCSGAYLWCASMPCVCALPALEASAMQGQPCLHPSYALVEQTSMARVLAGHSSHTLRELLLMECDAVRV